MHVSAQPRRAHKHGHFAAYEVCIHAGEAKGGKGARGQVQIGVSSPGGDPRLEYKIRLGPAPHPYLLPLRERRWAGGYTDQDLQWGWGEGNASEVMRRNDFFFS